MKKIFYFLPLMVLTYLVASNIFLLNRGEVKVGTLDSCTTLRSPSGKPQSRNVPVVKMDDGKKVYGIMGELKLFDFCKKSIGSKVEVIIDPNDFKSSRILTFWQFGFLPTLFLFFSILWMYAGRKSFKS